MTKRKTAKKCRIDGCTSNSKTKGLCKKHGGGNRCTASGCQKSARPGGTKCIAHGGGLCKMEGCLSGARSAGLCLLHKRIAAIRKKHEATTQTLPPKTCESKPAQSPTAAPASAPLRRYKTLVSDLQYERQANRVNPIECFCVCHYPLLSPPQFLPTYPPLNFQTDPSLLSLVFGDSEP